MTSRTVWIIAFVTAGVVAIAGAGFFAYRQILSASAVPAGTNDAITYVDANFPVRVSTTPGSAVPLGGITHFDVTATSNHPIRRIEFWDGDKRIDSQPSGAATFTFPAIAVGPHLLYARAIDQAGAVSYSRMTNLDVQYSGPSTLTNLTTGQVVQAADPPHVVLALRSGETSATVAARLDVPAADVQASGGHAYIATHAPTVEPMSGNKLSIAKPSTVSAGALRITAQGCGVRIAGGKAGAPVAEGSANAAGFVQVAKLAGDGTAALSALTPGQHVLFAHAESGDTAPIAVVVPQSCASHLGWSGDVTILDGILTLPQGLTNAYLYVQAAAGQAYRRFPVNSDEYLPNGARRIDLGASSPLIGSDRTTVQVWTLQGTTARKVATGTFTRKGILDASQLPPLRTLQVNATNGIWITPNLTQKVTEKLDPFPVQWRGSDPQLSALEWQVSAYPPTAWGAPTDLLYDWTEVPYGAWTPQGGEQSFDPKEFVGITGTDSHGQYKIDKSAGVDRVLQAQLRANGGTVYLRAIGLDRNPASKGDFSNKPRYLPNGAVSPVISVVLPPAQPAPHLTTFEITSLTLDNGRFPNSTHEKCATVTVDWAAHPPPPAANTDNLAATQAALAYASARHTYPVSGIWCMATQHSSCSLFCSVAKGIEAVVDALGSVWDFISSAYNGLIADVVKLAVFLNPVCAAIKGASSSGGDYCDTITSIAAQAAIDVVLTAYGLPPSLPSSAQAAAAAKGDLTELGEVYLESLGVPCDSATVAGVEADGVSAAAGAAGATIEPDANGEIDACKALIGAALNQIQSAVGESAQAQVTASTGLPGCPIQWCTFAVDPGARLQPPVLHVEAKRVSGPVVPGAIIPISVSFSSNKDQDVLPAVWAGGDGKLISADGQTIVQDLVFNQVAQYGDQNEYGAAYDPNYHPNGSVREDDKGYVPDWQITARLTDYSAKTVYITAGPKAVTAGFAPAEADAPQ